ncbi:methyltransferase domain-containing protein [Agromyces mediolanus]|uniref:methyltransferase domain-containing protein n=1 Tax=Agromyces mediolanus TaxID=41986 RepID=UPI00203CC1A6|nr:methyltransferase domain-containing protein [Agromyces mediolanus]MCM3657546.1 methyltransferase domain-containing protein [Agromyces mediolanus]
MGWWRELGSRDADAVELMDDPDCDGDTLARTYLRFTPVNRAVSAPRERYLRWIRPRLSPAFETRLLDVGTGAADLPLLWLRWAEADGLRLRVTAIDPDRRALAFAEAAGAGTPGLTLLDATTAELAAADEHFDLVCSNHVLHHLDGREFGALLADSERLAELGGTVVHADLERSRLAYAAFALGTLPFEPNLLRGSFIRADGLTSIRRSHTAAELEAILPAGWRVRRAFPSRLELVWQADAAGRSRV